MVYAGQGRSMELLWRPEAPHRRKAGPKPGLSVEVIVAAAVAIADEAGMDALSMRAVGERLGRSGMALYTYVPGKSELIDLMYDRVLAELPADYDLSSGWRPALWEWAHDTWDFNLRHPWILQVSQARPVLGPGEFRTIETLATILRQTGLHPDTVRPVVAALTHFIRGSTQIIADSRQAAAATGISEAEWWAGRSGKLQEYVPDLGAYFPNIVWLESGNVPGPTEEATSYFEWGARQNFDTGLTLLLDGIDRACRAEG